MKLECPNCGIVEAVERTGMHVYWECGIPENIILLGVPQSYCPHCDSWLAISIWAISKLHDIIAVAVRRKRNKTAAEQTFLRKYESYRENNDISLTPQGIVDNSRRDIESQPWSYRRRGQLIELFLIDGPGNPRRAA